MDGPRSPKSPYAELWYGGCFFASAMIGMALGLMCLTPTIRGGPIDAQIYEDVSNAVIGAIVGAVVWLWWKYSLTLTGTQNSGGDQNPPA